MRASTHRLLDDGRLIVIGRSDLHGLALAGRDTGRLGLFFLLGLGGGLLSGLGLGLRLLDGLIGLALRAGLGLALRKSDGRST